DAQAEQLIGPGAHRGVEIELAAAAVLEQKRPLPRLEELADLRENDVHHLADVQRRGQRFADLVEDRELVDGALQLPEEILPPHSVECMRSCRGAPIPL